MQSKTYITKYTPAVLRAVCKKLGLKKREFRLNTLKRVGVGLASILENPAMDDADREVLTDLHNAVRLACGDE